jgi:hypothetical protein
MKKLIFLSFLIIGAISGTAQASRADLLQNLERAQQSNQDVITTATLKSASRLFGEKDDLTSVIMIIPVDSVVTVLGSDSTYLHVTFQDAEGYIYKKDAVINQTPVVITQPARPQQQVQYNQNQPQNQQDQQESRFSYLENKYGSNMAARLMAGKIWKGMNSEMVNDSWGTAQKINRVISGNVVKEEWIYRNTWLYFENNTLVDWGPVKR